MKEVRLPEIAENVEEGTVTSVLVAEGDSVSADQNILELETDKASVEVPAPFGGTVSEILVSEGQDVQVGDVVMKFDADDETGGEGGDSESSDGDDESKEDSSKDQPQAEDKTAEKQKTKRKDEGESGDGKSSQGRKEKKAASESTSGSSKEKKTEDRSTGASDVAASPATRRMAREIGVDISQVSGSGAGGRVTEKDVKDAARDSGGTGDRTGSKKVAQSGERREQMTKVRSLTAERTQSAWQEIPHVTQFDEADLSRLGEFMEATAGKVEKQGGKLTVTAVLVKLCAHALRAFPRFNASLDMENSEIVYHDRVAIGVAADTDRGLLVPVLEDPDKKDVVTIALELGELAAAARSGELEVSQMQGGTFSLSNLGGIGGTAFTPVVVQPQVAILGVARSATKPVYVNNRFEPREMLPLALSYDHRAIDGADGARFVSWIKTAIEDPFSALMQGGA